MVTGKGNAWHPGVVGIVAGKLANSLNKPCLVLAHSANGEYCGSGRGVPGVNLVEILSECQNTLSHWGGHPIAVGLGLKGENLDIFIPQFLAAVKKSASVKKEDSHILIDAVVNKEELRYELLWEMNKLNPYGQGNPEPILAVKKNRS